MLEHKSRYIWLTEGDKNSKFFHFYMKARFKRNNIVALKSGEDLIKDARSVKGLVFNHFKEHFQESNHRSPSLEKVAFNELSLEESTSLEEPFSFQD